MRVLACSAVLFLSLVSNVFADTEFTIVCPDAKAVQDKLTWWDPAPNVSSSGSSEFFLSKVRLMGKIVLTPKLDTGIEPSMTLVPGPGIPVIENRTDIDPMKPFKRSYFGCLYKIEKTSLPIVGFSQYITDSFGGRFPDHQGNTYFDVSDVIPFGQCSSKGNKITCIVSKP